MDAAGGVERENFAAIYDPALLPKPTVSIKGKPTRETSRRAFKLRGASVNASRVMVKSGKGPFVAAKGSARWTRKVRLQPGRNRIFVRSFNAADAESAPARLLVVRK